MIKVNNVSKSFGKEENRTQVLRGVNLEIEKGEFVSLMGASGSGKSTLLYLIGGLDRGFDGSFPRSACKRSVSSSSFIILCRT